MLGLNVEMMFKNNAETGRYIPIRICVCLAHMRGGHKLVRTRESSEKKTHMHGLRVDRC